MSDDINAAQPGRRSARPLTIALYLNAALLAIIAAALIGRAQPSVGIDSTAFGQQAPQAIAGGAGFYLMPAQFAGNSWGCYVMDVDAQTLIAYVYDRPAGADKPQLRLAAARSFAFDRQLRSYNTGFPTPAEAEQIVKLERETSRRPEEQSTQPTTTEP